MKHKPTKSLRLTDELLEQLKEEAQRLQISESELVRKILMSYFETKRGSTT